MILEFLPIGLYLIGLSGYFSFSSNLDKSDKRSFVLRLLLPTFLLGLVEYFFPVQQLSGFAIGSIIIAGLLWMFVFPWEYAFVHKKNGTYSFPYDFYGGLYLVSWYFLLLLLIESLCSITTAAVLKTLLFVVVAYVPLTELVYFKLYGTHINFLTLQTIYYTDIEEVKDYLRGLPLKLHLAFWMGFALLIGIQYKLNASVSSVALSTIQLVASVILVLILGFVLLGGKKSVFGHCAIGKLCFKVARYQKTLATYEAKHKVLYEALQAKSNLPDNFGTIMLVIGESANRTHMQAFNEAYERETTPWLKKCKDEEQWHILKNSYSCHVQTAPCLELALTNASQYKNVDLDQRISLVDVANKCDFVTYWYSNQGMSGSNSTPITVIGRNASVSRWSAEDKVIGKKDEYLLNYLEQIPQDGKNKLIVLHIMGSHAEFNNRYPKEFEKWPVAEGNHVGANPYDNSILYTDYVLEQLYKYGKEKLNMQAMVYCSDHSTDIGTKRKPYFTGFECVKIPCCVYLSQKYQELFGTTAKGLKEHENKYFTNDLLFDLLLGLMQVEGDIYDKEADISNAAYKYTKETLKTDLGKRCLAEDC